MATSTRDKICENVTIIQSLDNCNNSWIDDTVLLEVMKRLIPDTPAAINEKDLNAAVRAKGKFYKNLTCHDTPNKLGIFKA